MLDNFHVRLIKVELFDAELLLDILRKSVLVNYDVESLCSYEWIRCVPDALVLA